MAEEETNLSKTNSPKISVVVPVFNVEKYLRRCIDSILAQTFTDFECILVDDGSPDGSPAICDDYAEKDSRVRVIHQQNKGVSAARNAGLDAARGEWIVFVDSDDWIEAETYETAYNAAIKNSANLVQWNIVMEKAGKKPYKSKWQEGLFSVLKDATYFEPSVGNKVISKRLLCDNDIRFPENTRLSEDKAFSFQCYLSAKACYQIVNCFYHYDYRMNSASHTISKEMIIQEANTVKSMETWAKRKNFENYEIIIYEQKRICKQHSVLQMKKPEFDLCRTFFPETNKSVLQEKTKFSVLFFFIYFHFDFAALLLIKIWKILRKV